jgi:hypothetical protein
MAVVRQLDERAASLYRQCSKTCHAHVTTVANRRVTQGMTSACSAPFVKSLNCECSPLAVVWAHGEREYRLTFSAVLQTNGTAGLRLGYCG